MKALFISAIGSILASLFMSAAESVLQVGGNPSGTPKELSSNDWSGIRGAYEKHRHAVVNNQDGSHQARNPGQSWLAKFDGRGVTVIPDAGRWTWGMELIGYGESIEVSEEGNKILYTREDGLTEWFINDTRGLEQGWTFEKRPERAVTPGRVRLDLTVRGELRPQVSEDACRVSFVDSAGRAVLNYGGLRAWDRDGKNGRY